MSSRSLALAKSRAPRFCSTAATPKSRNASGNFVKPTILDGLPATSELADTEIFGPVLSLVHANDLDEALAWLERSPYGNRPHCSRRAARPRDASAMKRPPGTSESTSVLPRPWPISRSVDGKTASSAYARPGPRCGRVLYREEGRRRALGEGALAKILILQNLQPRRTRSYTKVKSRETLVLFLFVHGVEGEIANI